MIAMLRAVASSFSVFRNRNFSIYLGGQAVSLIGTWLQVTAQGWVVWKLTGSTVDLGVTSMLSTLPLLLLAPWAGSWADRYNRRKLLIATQLGAMALAFILAFLVLLETVQLWHVYVLSLLLGIITAIDMPAQQAFLGDLAGTNEIRKAVNVNIMIVQVSRLLGPAVAGVVIANYGAGPTFLLNGLSFVAVVISLSLVRKVKLSRAGHSNDNALRGFREALQFITSQPRLVDLVLFVILLTFFGMAIVVNILPAVATNVLHGDASLLGGLMSASGAGALIGTVVIAPWVQTLRRTGFVLSIAMMFSAASLMVLGFSNIPFLSMAALFMSGLAAPSIFTTVMGLLQFSTPPEMRARVVGLFLMVSFGLQPLAALWIGWTAEPGHLGIQPAIVLNTVLLMTGALIMLLRTSLREWQHMPPVPSSVPLTEAGD